MSMYPKIIITRINLYKLTRNPLAEHIGSLEDARKVFDKIPEREKSYHTVSCDLGGMDMCMAIVKKVCSVLSGNRVLDFGF